MNKVSGQIEEFYSIGAIWLLFLINMSKKISLSVPLIFLHIEIPNS